MAHSIARGGSSIRGLRRRLGARGVLGAEREILVPSGSEGPYRGTEPLQRGSTIFCHHPRRRGGGVSPAWAASAPTTVVVTPAAVSSRSGSGPPSAEDSSPAVSRTAAGSPPSRSASSAVSAGGGSASAVRSSFPPAVGGGASARPRLHRRRPPRFRRSRPPRPARRSRHARARAGRRVCRAGGASARRPRCRRRRGRRRCPRRFLSRPGRVVVAVPASAPAALAPPSAVLVALGRAPFAVLAFVVGRLAFVVGRLAFVVGRLAFVVLADAARGRRDDLHLVVGRDQAVAALDDHGQPVAFLDPDERLPLRFRR